MISGIKVVIDLFYLIFVAIHHKARSVTATACSSCCGSVRSGFVQFFIPGGKFSKDKRDQLHELNLVSGVRYDLTALICIIRSCIL